MGINNSVRGPQVGLFAGLPGWFGFSGAQVRTHRSTKALRPGLYRWPTQDSAGSARGLRVAETGFRSHQGGAGGETDSGEVGSQQGILSTQASLSLPLASPHPSAQHEALRVSGHAEGPGPGPGLSRAAFHSQGQAAWALLELAWFLWLLPRGEISSDEAFL